MAEKSERLDEVFVRGGNSFDEEEAISSIKFYSNLARKNNEKLVIEIWKLNKEKPKCLNTS